MKIVLTGADGFVGEHVARALLQAGHEVVGAITYPEPRLRTFSPAETASIEWRTFDLRDEGSVGRVIRDTDPDGVVHLAAIASVSQAWRDPERTFQVNALGTLHLLNAMRRLPGTLRRPVLLVGSGEAYGIDGTDENPLTEAVPLRPISPYGGSKAAQEMIGWSCGRTESLRLVMTRSFQHAGPGQHPWYVLSDWAQQLLRLRKSGSAAPIMVGNVSIVRDFSDVRDAAEAYAGLLFNESAEGVFNVCSGHGQVLEQMLKRLQRIVGVDVPVRVDPSKHRPAELQSLVGDPSLLTRTTGWTPTRPIDETLADLVEYLSRRGGA